MHKHDFQFDNKSGSLLITINESKFDASGVDDFRQKLVEAWNDRIRLVKIDFSEVEFIDSSGIGALLSVQKRLTQTDEPVTILNAQPPVISVIELLRLQRVFTLQNNGC